MGLRCSEVQSILITFSGVGFPVKFFYLKFSLNVLYRHCIVLQSNLCTVSEVGFPVKLDCKKVLYKGAAIHLYFLSMSQ